MNELNAFYIFNSICEKYKSKVLQYSTNMIHNLPAPNTFAHIMWDVKPDTLWVLLTWFAFMAYSTVSKSTVFGLPYIAWLSRFFQPEQKFH